MILFLDGGYTQTAGNEACAELIQECTQKEALVSVKIEENMDWNRVFRDLEDADAIVLAADVYLESIGGRFYAVLYTELYEGEQTSVAMEVLKNFCVHANITWGRGLGIGGNKIETLLRKDSFWGRLHKSTSDFRTASLQEHALFIREKIQGTDVYIKPEEVSRKGYIRKINQKMKKSNRVKFAQNECKLIKISALSTRKNSYF